MCEEYITNDTDAGKITVALHAANHLCVEYYSDTAEAWRESSYYSRAITAILRGTHLYRIKNPDYVKKPVKGEIWANDFGGSGHYPWFATFNGHHMVFSDGSCVRRGHAAFDLKHWKFTGQTTDMYEKIEALEKGL